MQEELKKIVFLGSRLNVINELLVDAKVIDLTIYALKNSLLETFLINNNIVHNVFSIKDKDKCLKELFSLNFDILISNGCPIIFPINKFKKQQILINIHPTYLPHLQGKTPMNGVFYLGYKFYGATMHYIDHGIDTGDIIYQEKEDLTDDIDLGLLYHLAMALEGSVFKKGWDKLKRAKFKHIGVAQQGESTYFNRAKDMQNLDFKSETTNRLLLKIKSFGIKSQGCIAKIGGINYRVFEAEKIKSNPLLKKYKYEIPGEILLSYDEKFLVKTIDGIIKVKKYETYV